MSLKSKIGLIIIGVFVFHGALDLYIQRFLILPSFYTLEEEEARKDLSRVIQALNREILHIDTLCHDWGAWDETYQYISSPSDEYIETNVPTSAFMDNRLNVICYCDAKGKIVWKEMRDIATGDKMRIAGFPEDFFPSFHPLVSYRTDNGPLSTVKVSGFILTENGPLLISARPILTNNNEGPVRGTLMMARLLRSESIESLVDQTRVRFEVKPVLLGQMPEKYKRMKTSPESPAQSLIEKIDTDYLQVSTVVGDIENRGGLIVMAKVPRQISSKGRITARYALISSTTAGFLFLIVMLFVLQRIVLNPLSELIRHALFVKETGDLSARLSMKGKDEVSRLADGFDTMMDQLERSTNDLSEMNLTLKKSQDELAGILNSVYDPIIAWDRECRIIWTNNVAISYFSSDLVGKKCSETLCPGTGVCLLCHVEKCFIDDIRREFELTVTKNNGEDMDCWCTAGVAARAEDGTPLSVIVLYHDVTEKKRLQAEALRTSQLAAVGELAAGVAHEVNNPVNSIINYAQILINETALDSLAQEMGCRILKEGDRVAVIVKSLLSFSREGKSKKQKISINAVLKEVVALVEALLKKDGVNIRIRIPEDLPSIDGNFQHLQQVFLNVVTNARYALNSKYPGRHDDKVFEITCERVDINGTPFIRTSFRDNGVGIPQKIQDKVMEPFFTTKPSGAGTGLGLSISHGIIADHGGKIQIKSKEGEYTQVDVDLPEKGEYGEQDSGH